MPEGYEAILEGIDSEVEIELVGLASDIYHINEGDIVGYIDMQDVMEVSGITEWSEGTYDTTLKFNFQEDITTGQDIPVRVVLEKVEE